MKAGKDIKAKVVAPYNYQNDPVSHGVPGLSKGPTLKVTRKNTTVEHDATDGKKRTSGDFATSDPLMSGDRALKRLKGFKQAETMTIEKTGFKHNPVRQDINEAWGRFTGQQEQ